MRPADRHDSDAAADLTAIRESVLPILEDHAADLVLAGHSHAYERSILLDGHYGTSDTYDPTQHALDPTTAAASPAAPTASPPAPGATPAPSHRRRQRRLDRRRQPRPPGGDSLHGHQIQR